MQYSPEHLLLEASWEDGLDLPVCFPQGPEGFSSVGFAPPAGSRAALDPSGPGHSPGLILTWSMQLGLICISNKANLGPEQTIELKC